MTAILESRQAEVDLAKEVDSLQSRSDGLTVDIMVTARSQLAYCSRTAPSVTGVSVASRDSIDK